MAELSCLGPSVPYCRICWGRVSLTLARSLTVRKSVLESVEDQAEIWNRGHPAAIGVPPMVTKPLLDPDHSPY